MDPGKAKATRVLIVDDDPAVAATMAEVLRLEGYEPEIATDGLAALASLRTKQYDVIVSDMRMSGLDGPALYHELRRHYPGIARRFIACSADVGSPPIRMFLEQTGVPRIEKPFTIDQVRRAVTGVARAA